ncbi:acyltransferase [Demequina flava]|uniref:acyltransferase n=1 Tax=Demequina flava TaxID=1095025 RepID=UPI0007808221|nr:acyltransferase [Demequina flava]
MASVRNAKIELLRILAMVGIVAHHYVVHGGVLTQTESANTAIFLSAFGSLGKWGVDVFVLVGAWFMVQRPARGKALSRIYSEVLPVSWLIAALLAVTGAVALSTADVREALLPVIFSEYWFVTAYVLMVLIAPYLAIVLEALSKQQLARLLIVGLVMWSLLTLVPRVALGLSDFAWFAFLFLLAGYLRLHGLPGTGRWWGWATLIATGALVLAPAAMAAWSSASGSPGDSARWLKEVASQTSPLTVAAAVAILMWATKSAPWRSRAIVYAASASFGVYLIHDNPLVRRVLWPDVVDTPSAAGQSWLPLHAIGWTLAVYIACSIAIFALQPVLLRPMHRLTESIRRGVEQRLDRANSGPQP